MVTKTDKEHNLRMTELKYARETEDIKFHNLLKLEKIKHDNELERMRIKSAEIRKGYERKKWANERQNQY